MQIKKEKKKAFPLSLSPSTVGDIDTIAENNQRSRSSQVQIILEEYLKTQNLTK